MYRKMRNFRGRGRRFAAGLASSLAGLAMPAAAGTAPAAASPAVPRWIHIAAGGDFTCGIREGNTLWCWGSATAGDLGTGATTDQHQPQQLGKPTAAWVSVTAGQDHACALRRDGTLWCWGNDLDGETGTRPGRASVPRPRQVTTPAAGGWASVSAGSWHTCATRADGTLWCWGFGAFGQLGTGRTGPAQTVPQQVTAPAADGWTTAETGGDATCALRTHALWCWGSNYFGGLGIGGTTGQSVPRRVPVPTRTGWSLVSTSGYATCATHTGHALWCWGYNGDGELGLGTTTDQHRPQLVTA